MRHRFTDTGDKIESTMNSLEGEERMGKSSARASICNLDWRPESVR